MIYSIDLYKYPHINEFEIEDILNYQSEKMIGYNLKTTFSIFDKMLITPHNKIKDIRKVDKLNYTWTGKHQKTIIYDIPYTPTDNTIIFDKDDFKCYNEPDRSVNFMSISMITLSPDAQKYFIWHKDNFIDKINHYIKEICNLVENNNSGINFKLYGTLGSNDFTLILLSDDYANIVYTVEALKYYKLKYEDIEKYYSVIVDIYTIINWSNKDNNLISNNRPIDIFLSERINFDITDNFVPKKVILGEYDIHLNENLDPSKYLLGGKYDFFDINQFNKNYFQINTQISYEVDNLSQYIPNKNNKLNIGSQYIYIKIKLKMNLENLKIFLNYY